jgi:CMP-N-acetylneuraminic acid synthetase
MGAHAIIPARGGSKGIPQKNLRTVGGRSLVARAVDSAIRSELFGRVYVSTDSAEIADQAAKAGAEVLHRPSALAEDETSTEAVIDFHLENELKGFAGVLGLIQCTSPFIRPKSLQAGHSLLLGESHDSVFSARTDHTFRWVPTQGGSWQTLGHKKNERPRRQDLPDTVIETGGFYFFSAELFRTEKTRFCGSTGIVLVDRLESLEIDEPDDLDFANILADRLGTE